MSIQREASVNDAVAHNMALNSVRDSIINEIYEEQTASGADRFKFKSLSSKTYSGKRIIDLFLGLVGLILYLVLFPFIAIGIKIFSAGPVIFKQKRTGQNGKAFICYKFRTMHQLKLRRLDGKPVVTQKGDKRIFGFGSFLRQTNLDELPQIINVLKGDMSLVGPRPYPVDECLHWNNTFNDFYFRYSVKPGISGYAQVTGFRGGTLDEEHMRKRLDRDLVYVQKQDFWFDIKIIFRTLTQMVHSETNAH